MVIALGIALAVSVVGVIVLGVILSLVLDDAHEMFTELDSARRENADLWRRFDAADDALADGSYRAFRQSIIVDSCVTCGHSVAWHGLDAGECQLAMPSDRCGCDKFASSADALLDDLAASERHVRQENTGHGAPFDEHPEWNTMRTRTTVPRFGPATIPDPNGGPGATLYR